MRQKSILLGKTPTLTFLMLFERFLKNLKKVSVGGTIIKKVGKI
jgi:hypothetical protein